MKRRRKWDANKSKSDKNDNRFKNNRNSMTIAYSWQANGKVMDVNQSILLSSEYPSGENVKCEVHTFFFLPNYKQHPFFEF